jgi:hypothetical protein
VFVFQLYQGGNISADDRLELDQICSEHIAASVDLRWHILSNGARGRVSLKGITLTQEMLDLVRMSPLQWGMYCFYCIILVILQKNNGTFIVLRNFPVKIFFNDGLDPLESHTVLTL